MSKLRPWTLVLIASLLYLGAIFILNDVDPVVFVTPGECFSQCVGRDGTDCHDEATGTDYSEGYDGQFAYYIARDPLDAPDCLDVPAYRMQRILLPALGMVLSFGQDGLVPWALVAINLAALVGGTALLEDLLVQEGRKRWFALTYGLFIGVFMAVRLSTNEPLAYGLVIAAIWLGQHERRWAAAGVFLLAGLAKETIGLFVAGYLLYFALHGRWRDALRLGLVVGVPFAAWQIVLYAWLGDFGIGSGGALATSFEIIPYMGVWRIAGDSLVAFILLGLGLFIPSAVLPSVWALWHTVQDLRRQRWHLYTCLLLANAAIMPFIPFSTYREFLGLWRFIPGLVMVFVLYAAHYHYRRPLMYSTLWIMLSLFVVSG
jgi:hypothetical protein